MTFHQQPQFGKCLVWGEIRVNDHSRCGLRFSYNTVTRQNTHSANERIHVHKGRNLGFVVHKRIGVQFRGFFNELLVKLLSSRPLLRQPSRAILAALRDPSGQQRCQTSDGGPAKRRKRRNVSRIHVASICQIE